MPVRMLPQVPDATSPGSGTQIRHLIQLPQGDLTHAVCPAGEVAVTHHLPGLFEGYYVLAGQGELWRRTDAREGITALRPGRWIHMPAGTRFQYRAYPQSALVLLVTVLPSWRPELFHLLRDEGRWAAGITTTQPATPPSEVSDWLCGDRPFGYDYLAPDGSEVRLLGDAPDGGLSHCTLNAGHVSSAVRHRTVHEIWYVTRGHGELWRNPPAGEESVVILWPGLAVDIPRGVAFQFRSTGADPLEVIILTMPRWPGAEEAEPEARPRWQ